MGRILCLDYGLKRVGVAVTDELQIIASPLDTINTSEIISFISKYIKENEVELLVVGLPFNLKGEETDATNKTLSFIRLLKKTHPLVKVDTYDERYTSKIAKDTILMMGKNKKFRRDKSNIDKLSASIILQSYLKRKSL
ncbi:MAG: Holliday junction resolvase RuvX [Cytophagia bacterium]|jgi:putative Holliday junction resolvase|nr:Holliday junction resolvase RuvX [Cytophagia bacterium]|tara:strand:- start:2269 stop:2685 length:417 start_codon:yes stop_codon:yes gene_type:complete